MNQVLKPFIVETHDAKTYTVIGIFIGYAQRIQGFPPVSTPMFLAVDQESYQFRKLDTSNCKFVDFYKDEKTPFSQEDITRIREQGNEIQKIMLARELAGRKDADNLKRMLSDSNENIKIEAGKGLIRLERWEDIERLLEDEGENSNIREALEKYIGIFGAEKTIPTPSPISTKYPFYIEIDNENRLVVAIYMKSSSPNEIPQPKFLVVDEENKRFSSVEPTRCRFVKPYETFQK